MSNGTGSDGRGEAAAFLRDYSDRMERLLTLLAKTHNMTRGELAEVKDEYRALKERMRETLGQLLKGNARGSLDEFQAHYVLPAIQEAITRLRPATNTHPLNSDWLGAIYSAKIDIDQMLAQLKG